MKNNKKKYVKSIRELAKHYGCSYSWAHKIKSELPRFAAVRIGRGYRIDLEQVERLLVDRTS